MDPNARVVEYVLGECRDRLPPAVVVQAKRCLLDLVGATLAGAGSPGAEILKAHALATMGGQAEASLIRDTQRVPAPAAALVNGFAANALDIDDGYREVCGHPGAVVFPAALSVGETLGAPGTALLEALVVGYEVAIRAGLAMRPSYGDVFHCSGSWGAVGAAAACGRLLGLDPGRLAHALGIAEAHGPLIPTRREVTHPAMTKDGVAWGAFGGVTAALLAQRGFTGMRALFEQAPVAAAVEGLGSTYLMERLYFKPYPCCRWFQPAIEGVRILRVQHDIGPDDVARIEVHTFAAAADGLTRNPRSQEEAEYSLPYCVAAVAVRGRFGRAEVAEAAWRDARILDLARRVEVSVAPELEARFPTETLARVTIVTARGRRVECGPLPARGGADAPLSDAEIRAKYEELVEGVLSAPAARDLAEAVEAVEELKDVRELVALMQA